MPIKKKNKTYGIVGVHHVVEGGVQVAAELLPVAEHEGGDHAQTHQYELEQVEGDEASVVLEYL